MREPSVARKFEEEREEKPLSSEEIIKELSQFPDFKEDSRGELTAGYLTLDQLLKRQQSLELTDFYSFTKREQEEIIKILQSKIGENRQMSEFFIELYDSVNIPLNIKKELLFKAITSPQAAYKFEKGEKEKYGLDEEEYKRAHSIVRKAMFEIYYPTRMIYPSEKSEIEQTPEISEKEFVRRTFYDILYTEENLEKKFADIIRNDKEAAFRLFMVIFGSDRLESEVISKFIFSHIEYFAILDPSQFKEIASKAIETQWGAASFRANVEQIEKFFKENPSFNIVEMKDSLFRGQDKIIFLEELHDRVREEEYITRKRGLPKLDLRPIVFFEIIAKHQPSFILPRPPKNFKELTNYFNEDGYKNFIHSIEEDKELGLFVVHNLALFKENLAKEKFQQLIIDAIEDNPRAALDFIEETGLLEKFNIRRIREKNPEKLLNVIKSLIKESKDVAFYIVNYPNKLINFLKNPDAVKELVDIAIAINPVVAISFLKKLEKNPEVFEAVPGIKDLENRAHGFIRLPEKPEDAKYKKYKKLTEEEFELLLKEKYNKERVLPEPIKDIDNLDKIIQVAEWSASPPRYQMGPEKLGKETTPEE